MRKLKVYGAWRFRAGKQVRAIAAVNSQKEFAALLDTSLNFVRGYASETGNACELKIAFSKPGTMFWAPLNDAMRENSYQEWTDER
jgi:hypothetical protein